MYPIALALHLLGTVIWVGGMFFAHMALRPAAEELLEPPQRLQLLKRVLDRFFLWVWGAMIAVLASGYGIFLGVFGGKSAIYVHVMSLIGLIMAALFLFIWFVPYRKMGEALERQEFLAAGSQMALMRRIIGVNLVLGLIEVVLGGLKPF